MISGSGWPGASSSCQHFHYETIEPYPLQRTDIDPDATRKAYKAKPKADKANGVIELDTLTTLSGIPPQAWA